MAPQAVRVVLLGKSGVGKSASGNTILGKKSFMSKVTFKSVTTECQEDTCTIDGMDITVVDTPGFYGTSDFNETIKSKCNETLKLCATVPCVFLVLIKLDRFTQEEKMAIEEIEEMLGNEGVRRSLVLFTRGDNLEDRNIEEFLQDDDGELQTILERFDGRYHVFNNKSSSPEQVMDLCKKIQNIVHANAHTDVVDNSLNTGNIQRNRNERQIVMLGRTGVGKSLSGNTILNLTPKQGFKSNGGFSAVTRSSTKMSKCIAGQKVTVVDTPGLFDTDLDIKHVITEIMKSIFLCAEGTHAFLIVIEFGRFTKQDIKVIELLKKVFGKDALKYALVLFTHGDDPGSKDIDSKIKENKYIADLINQCRGKYHVFNNMNKNRQQVFELLKKIDNIVEENKGEVFSSDNYKSAQKILQEVIQKKQSHPKKGRKRHNGKVVQDGTTGGVEDTVKDVRDVTGSGGGDEVERLGRDEAGSTGWDVAKSLGTEETESAWTIFKNLFKKFIEKIVQFFKPSWKFGTGSESASESSSLIHNEQSPK